jgi:hypothetical protein
LTRTARALELEEKPMMPRSRRRVPILVLTALLIGSAVGPASAFPLLMDYTGFTWNSFQYGSPMFHSVGVLDGFEPGGLVDDSEVYTYCMSDLALDNVDYLGSGRYLRTYTGGNFGIYRSTDESNRGYDYGVNPTNPTAPASFVDGELWLNGSFGSFSLIVDQEHGLATMNGSGIYYEGAFLASLEGDNFFSYAGLTRSRTAGVPMGYEYRIDGQVSADATPPVDPVPEPASLMLFATGLIGTGVALRRRRR